MFFALNYLLIAQFNAFKLILYLNYQIISSLLIKQICIIINVGLYIISTMIILIMSLIIYIFVNMYNVILCIIKKDYINVKLHK